MKQLLLILLVVGFFLLFLAWGLLIWSGDGYQGDNLSIDLFGGAVLFLSFSVALLTYQDNRKRDEFQVAERRREYYIIDEKLKTMRMAIGHNDIQLQTIVSIANIMDYRKPGFMPEKIMKVHEDFDSYLGYMEGVAMLANRGHVSKESLKGLWSYYFKQLKQACLLDFNDLEFPVSIDDINDCIDELYEDRSQTARAIKTEIKKYIVKGTGKSEKAREPKDHNRDGSINPLERPIWYYINDRNNEFEAIIEFFIRFCSD